MDNFETFKKTFAWYRSLSLKLISQFPEEFMTEKINSRSLPANQQFIDLGEMQQKIAEKSLNKTFDIQKPSIESVNKEEILAYVNKVNDIVLNEFENADKSSVRLDWFGRMDFDYNETLAFMLAHEAMHHGEILSLIFARNIPMPQGFKDTWGFEKNLPEGVLPETH